MSSSAVSSLSIAQKLYGDGIRSIMSYLEVPDLSRAERTCHAWKAAASPMNTALSPWKTHAFDDYVKFSKERALRVIQLAAGGEDSSLDILRQVKQDIRPIVVPFIYRDRLRFTTPPLGELGWKFAGANPGVVPPIPPIPEEPNPFGSRQWAVYFPETLNGETPCLGTLEKVNRSATGSNYDHFSNGLSAAERTSIESKPMNLSGWYLVTIVEGSKNKPFAGPNGQKEFVRVNGHGQWQIASASQAMAVEILFRASGKPFLGNLWARSSEKTEAGNHLMVLGGSASHAPGVHILADSAHELLVVLALRKFPALGT